jgi:hypothetical protein
MDDEKLAYRHACRLLEAIAPDLVFLPTTVGVIDQIDNATVGLTQEITQLHGTISALKTDIAAIQIDSIKVGRMRELESALRGLMIAVTYAAPATLKFGEAAGPCYEARVPDEFILRAMAALGDK